MAIKDRLSKEKLYSSQSRPSQDKKSQGMEINLGQIKSCWERSSQVRTGNSFKTGQIDLDQVNLRQEKSSQVETGQVKLGR